MARFTPPAADAMRARLLLAARDEFAAVGLAAGRVERIGAAASSNKAQVFHYFGSKEGLFDALVADTVTETFAEAHSTPPTSPPGPAGCTSRTSSPLGPAARDLAPAGACRRPA